MQRRTFFKALAGAVAGGIAALKGRDHVREVAEKVKTPLKKTTETYTTYEVEVVNLNADMADGIWCDSRAMKNSGIDHFVRRPGRA